MTLGIAPVDPAPRGTAPHRLGVVTGLASEAAVISQIIAETDAQVQVVCAGANSERAKRLAGQLVAEGAQTLLSFGVAGGLSPDLDCGELIVAETLRGPDGTNYPTDVAWREALTTTLTEITLHYRQGAILGSARTLRETADKQAAFKDSGCLAVDMESAAVAAIAAESGLPFLAVRAVADCATDSLPGFVASAVKPDGKPAIGRALAALARRPGDIPATLRLARQTELALARLRMLGSVREVLLGRF